MDIYSGTVFNVGQRNPNAGASVKSFMESMGVDPAKPAEFKPIDYSQQNMQATGDAYDAYLGAMESLNTFGMQMAAKGVDLMRPRRDDPEAMAAYRTFSRLMRIANQHGTALRTSHELGKLYQQQRLRDGIFGPPLDSQKEVTMDDLNALANTNPFVKQLLTSVGHVNQSFAKSYDTEAEKDSANAEIDTRLDKMEDFLQPIVQSGVPHDIARLIIDNAKNSIGRATYDPLAERRLGLEASRMRAQNANAAARLKLAEKQVAGKGGTKADMAYQRKLLIQAIQNGDETYLSALKGGKVAGLTGQPKTITDVKYERDPKDGKKKIVLKTGVLSVKLDPDDPQSALTLSNVLNTVAGREYLSTEDLKLAPDPGPYVEGKTWDWAMPKNTNTNNPRLSDPNNPL